MKRYSVEDTHGSFTIPVRSHYLIVVYSNNDFLPRY